MSVGFVETGIGNRVTHHQIDRVGNNLTRTLAWCERHQEPAWVYGDQSFVCWWEYVTGHRQHLKDCGPEDHDIIPGPWEHDVSPAWEAYRDDD